MTDKKNVVLVADVFADQVLGGAELYNEELLKCLGQRGYATERLKSVEATPEIILQNKDCFWIIANFMLLSEQSKKILADGYDYLILEHDHKYCKSNNPLAYPKMIVPETELINRDFYKNAKAVCCQSALHAETLQKNLFIHNVVNLGCNLWDDETLALLDKNIGHTKTRKYGVMQSNNKNKGMQETLKYCRQNKIEAELIPFCKTPEFIQQLAKTETLVFFPQWMETYCRVAVEARILGCKLISNKALGCASEPYFQLKGKNLLNAIQAGKVAVLNTFEKIIAGEKVKFFNCINLPKISVITTIYKAKEYIRPFVESFLAQTIASQAELIIIEANSPDNESDLIRDLIEQNNNITYVKDPSQITPMQAFNIATQMYAKGEYIACVLVDDRMAKDHLESLAKHLWLDPSVDLVYGDCLQTTKPNETVEENSSRGRLYEHSRMEFTRENMIKCLPGPMPMYRKSLHDKAGPWNQELKHAGDWELWLRAVRAGSVFKKVNKVVGLYFFNPQGLSTSTDEDKMLRRRREEKAVFNEFKDVIGEANYNTFKDYFDAVQ